MAEHFFLYNDKAYPAGAAVITPANRSFRYGDGLFETMKVSGTHIINKNFHFERLFQGLFILDFDIPKGFNAESLERKIKQILGKNHHEKGARVRLSVFRGNGGIFDPESLRPNYIIETSPLPPDALNIKGLVVDIFPGARKSCDIFSNLKSNNYLPYFMAALFARKNKLDECLVLNSFERICDGTIANVFIIKGHNIYTPPLSDGCVAGTMRRWMLEKSSLKNYIMAEKCLTTEDLMEADEIFLTNAISHLRWVEKFREKKYPNKKIKEIYRIITKTI